MPLIDPVARKEYQRRYRERNLERLRERHREWCRSTKEVRNAYRRKWVAAHPRCDADRKLYWRYGITPELYAEMLAAQGGVCAICKKPPKPESLKMKRLQVDHDHKDHHIRGLLCSGCNNGLGHLEDYITEAVAYLERTKLVKAG